MALTSTLRTREASSRSTTPPHTGLVSLPQRHAALSVTSDLLLVLPQHVDIAALLIKYNTCVNATDKWAFTPLHEAAQKGRTQLCALLLAHGADPTMKNQEGQTALDLATVSAAITPASHIGMLIPQLCSHTVCSLRLMTSEPC